MPIYTFIGKGGETVERLVSSGTREICEDGELFFRGRLPEQFAFTGRNLAPRLEEKVKRGYYKMEQAKGARFNSSYSKNTIKKAWGF
jgi:hypothetical protein